jgi:hypothetical protein
MGNAMTARQTWERRGRRWTRQLVERFGAFGLIGIGLLLLAIGLGVVTPQLARDADELREQVDRTRGRMDEARRELAQRPGSAQRTAQLRESFPTVDQATADLRVIFDTAHTNRVELVKGEYSLAQTEDAIRLRRLEVTFPLKERYVTVKSFIAGVLNAVPHASLGELRLERSAANVDQIDARVHFTLFYREP